MIRGILGVVVGMVIGVLIIFGLEMLGHYVYPFPPGLDPNDPQALANFMKTAPLGAWLFVLAAYAAGSFAAGASGTWIGKNAWIGWVTGGLMTILGVMGLLMTPSPAWFWVVSLALYLPASWAGSRLVRRPVRS